MNILGFCQVRVSRYTALGWIAQKTPLPIFLLLLHVHIHCQEDAFTQPLPGNKHLL
jgi:hypothetical protein